MTQMLEILEMEFQISINNIIRALMEKIDNMQEQMGNITREMKTLRKNQNKIL